MENKKLKSKKLRYDKNGVLLAGSTNDSTVSESRRKRESEKSSSVDVSIGWDTTTIDIASPDGLSDDQRNELIRNLSDHRWRVFSGNVYKITDKDGDIVPFKPNRAQTRLFENLHNKNIILKARQQGFTTLIAILALDFVLFNSGKAAGLIAHSLDDASKIARTKIHFAYDKLPKWLRSLLPSGKNSDKEITFTSNDGGLYVDTSFRGGTLQFLHISEYAKIGVINPEKAKEIKTGALNAVPKDGLVFIESTSEGPRGEFYNMCQKAMKKQLSGKPLTSMDYKFFFFPWFLSDEYTLSDKECVGLSVDRETEEYFESLRGDAYIHAEYSDIEFTVGQKLWYQIKKDEQGESMYQEYPSTPKEAFDAVIDGAYFEKETNYIRSNNFVGDFGYDLKYPVYTAWDIGISDDMAIVFFQKIRGWIYHIIDFFEGSGWSMIDVCEEIIHKKDYRYATHFLPHDAEQRNVITGKTRKDEIEEYLGDVVVLPRLTTPDYINRARKILTRCRFDEYNSGELFEHICAYSRERDQKSGLFKAKPKHDEHSHAADAFKYMALSIDDPNGDGSAPVYDGGGLNAEYGMDYYKKPTVVDDAEYDFSASVDEWEFDFRITTE